jgi:hypothetical protein
VRAAFVIALCGLLMAIGVLFAARRSTLPFTSTVQPITSAALPSPPPPPTASERRSVPTGTPATAGLACVQNALGGVRAFADVSSLRIVGNTKPVATTGLRPVSNNREIRVAFPDRYERLDVQTGMPPGQVPLTSLVGFNGGVLLSQPRDPDDTIARQSARQDFVREMLMRLPREFADVRLSQRMIRDAEQERLAIDATGPDGLDATLLVERDTCIPVAIQYRSGTGLLTSRVDLSGYRAFGGIRFPTVLKTARNGQAWIEEHDSDVQVNVPHADFASGER